MESTAVNIFDAVIVILIVLSGVLAAFRGFVREVLAIAAWLGAAYLTYELFDRVSPYGRGLIEAEWIADMVSALVLFILLLVALWLVIHAVVLQVRKSALGPLDRSLGFVFGLARGVLLLGLVEIGLVLFGVQFSDLPDWVHKARTMIVINKAAALIVDVVPEDVLPLAADRLEALQNEARSGRQVLELQQLVDPPVEKEAADETGEPGYSETETRGMDRILDVLRPGTSEPDPSPE